MNIGTHSFAVALTGVYLYAQLLVTNDSRGSDCTELMEESCPTTKGRIE